MCFSQSIIIIRPSQFGFRVGANTTDAVLEFIDGVYTSFNKHVSTMTIFLDFSKAFDTVNHDILVSKLACCGLRGMAGDWFGSYLRDRRQYVEVGDSRSGFRNIKICVPQGSILGPVLFILFSNNMRNSSDSLKFIHFGDDTTVFLKNENLEILCAFANHELSKVDAWLYLTNYR